MNIVNAYVFSQCDHNGREYFAGECDALTIRTNVAELQGQFVEFLGDSRECVIEQIISALKSRGLTGKLRVK